MFLLLIKYLHFCLVYKNPDCCYDVFGYLITSFNPFIVEQQVLVSIIIVNYRSWASLKDCLDSLNGLNQKHVAFEVIVVDNFSNDGQLDQFSNEFSDFTFYENTGNNGFANGCNAGANLARGSYLLFLNPDTRVEDGVLESLLKVYKDSPEIGILSCAQKNEKGEFENQKKLFPAFSTFFGVFRSVERLINKRTNVERFKPSNNGVFYPDWVSGSVVFIHRNWFDKIIGWNEDYWMYLEDIDLSKRVSMLGAKVAVAKEITIFHAHGGASRINVKTKALTKTEVIISKHVYISNYMNKVEGFILHFLMIVGFLLERFVLALIGILLSFNKKMRVNIFIFANLIRYYINACLKGTWISPRSMKYPKRIR